MVYSVILTPPAPCTCAAKVRSWLPSHAAQDVPIPPATPLTPIATSPGHLKSLLCCCQGLCQQPQPLVAHSSLEVCQPKVGPQLQGHPGIPAAQQDKAGVHTNMPEYFSVMSQITTTQHDPGAPRANLAALEVRMYVAVTVAETAPTERPCRPFGSVVSRPYGHTCSPTTAAGRRHSCIHVNATHKPPTRPPEGCINVSLFTAVQLMIDIQLLDC